MSKTLRGTVTVNVGEDTYTLTPSLKEVRMLEQRFGGLQPAVQACQALNTEAVALVIIGGAGMKLTDIDHVQESVWQAGAASVAVQLLPHLLYLMNPSIKDADEVAEGKQDKKAQ